MHGIVDADVIDAPLWIEVYPPVAELLRARPIVVYNAEFDRRMIARMLLGRRIPRRGTGVALRHAPVRALRR